MVSLSIEHLSTTCDRGRVKAVNDASLDAPDGELLYYQALQTRGNPH